MKVNKGETPRAIQEEKKKQHKIGKRQKWEIK
jgi:hypothetical protein